MSSEMTAREFLITAQEICVHSECCGKCPLRVDRVPCIYNSIMKVGVAKLIEIVESYKKQKAASTTNADDLGV